MNDKRFEKLKKLLSEEKKTFNELEKVLENYDESSAQDKQMIETQSAALEKNAKKLYSEIKGAFSEILFNKPLEIEKKEDKKAKEPNLPKKRQEEKEEEDNKKLKSKGGQKYNLKDIKPNELENETIKKLREEEEEKSKKKVKGKSEYSKFASQVFSKYSRKLLGQKTFKKMEDQLIRANLNFTPVGYVSTIVLTTIISVFAAIFLFFFFLFFNFEATLPIITQAADPINIRFMKVFWILFVLPLGTFLFMYLYPSMEKKSAGEAIDTELPFATINMAAISGSMINPLKIFEIISSTDEYPALKKEFTKMINEINLYGYDLVSALKNTAKNSPSKRLTELLNGLSTTIHSGGDLVKFFDKRSQTLLFNHKIEQQKASKTAETTMDLYISLLIAAPMILMLLMMIMKISGLGIAMSVGNISLLVILGVVVANMVFMVFLHIKKTGK